MTDWSRYRKCKGCFAPLGKPCMSLTGVGPDGVAVFEFCDQPHYGRELRTGGAR